MVDAVPSYGYSTELMESLTGAVIQPLVNVGFCGLRSDLIDWEELELGCATVTAREGMHYFLEQALTAMLQANHSRIAAPAIDYIVFPPLEEGHNSTAVMHHYVAHSKRSHFQRGLQISLESNKEIT
jgi:hypothetical protein